MSYSYKDGVLTCDCCTASKIVAKFPHKLSCTESRGGFDTLTVREKEIALLLASNNTAKDIANKLNLAIKTVDKHRDNLFIKMGVHSKVELVINLYSLGIIVPSQAAIA